MRKFGTKNALFGYFWSRIFEIMFEISSRKSTLKILRQKQKCLNLGPKMLYMGIFGQEFQKTSVIFEISNLNFV